MQDYYSVHVLLVIRNTSITWAYTQVSLRSVGSNILVECTAWYCHFEPYLCISTKASLDLTSYEECVELYLCIYLCGNRISLQTLCCIYFEDMCLHVEALDFIGNSRSKPRPRVGGLGPDTCFCKSKKIEQVSTSKGTTAASTVRSSI